MLAKTDRPSVTSSTPAITTPTLATVLIGLKLIPMAKPKEAAPSKSTGTTGKTTGKTSDPAKNTRGQKRIQFLDCYHQFRKWKNLILIQKLRVSLNQ